ncbi:GNAT family N-acetyltransferase [Streptomyces sp. NPDC002952]|uniref:GNAT family N-acetyltransferase n=1 Tax=Streptomyces sp. NPDC002952 TaxID=3364673 RepID=UPI00368CBBCD
MDLSLNPPRFTPREFRELAALYESNSDYCRASGEFEPGRITAAQMETALREEAALDGSDILLARDADGRLIALVELLTLNPADGYPWIGLLMVHGSLRRRGTGRVLVDLFERRLRDGGARSVRLAVLHTTPDAMAFRTALGWRTVREAADNQHGRSCVVMHKDLDGPVA